MIEGLKGRTVAVVLFLLFCVIYLLPNFVKLPESWWFHKKPINYGLDIQGGAHLVYGVDVKGVLAERTERTGRTIAAELKERNVDAGVTVTGDAKDLITVTVKSEGDRPKVDEYLKEYYGAALQIVQDEGTTVQAKYYDAKMQEYRQQIIAQAIQVIRNRVDEFGVAEPVIAAQGTDRILVQLPGMTDPARAKELINKTAKLDFRMVDESMKPDQVAALVAEAEKTGNFALGKDGLTYAQYVKKVNETLKGKLPANTMISFEKHRSAISMEAGKTPYLLRTDTDVAGDQLEDAFVSFNNDTGEPHVAFKFNTDGRRKFAALTGNNIGKNMAIVLDEVVYSAPVIKDRIDGQGSISLGQGNMDEKQKEGALIATALRAGALPAALEQYEERSVGPSLGMDSIEKGKKAGAIGLIAIILFVCFYYKVAGVVASIALALNVVSLLAVLSALGATLTLPGIAGITLTVGMAIDANVIIYERIKEELARGLGFKSAVKDGFNHAWTAIFDSNVTTAIAAAVLIYFGSGPVRGFGVTLIAGIITTMFTAVFISHWMLDLLVSWSKDQKVSI